MKSRIKTKRNVKREIEHMTRIKGSSAVKVGLPSGSGSYPDGTSVASVGFWNEFGTYFAPERSWMRSAIHANRPKYRRLNKHNLKAVQQKKMSVRTAMTRLGQQARDDMITSIENFTTPELEDSTILAKGSARPLEDTGQMKQAVTYEVL